MSEHPRMERVSRKHPCEICGRSDWCGYTADGRLAVCMRVGDGALKQTRNGGYMHVLCDDPDWRTRPRTRTIRLHRREEERTDLGPLAREYAAAVDMGELRNFADELGLSVESLVRLRIGWAKDYRAWAFPMHDADGKHVRGIRLRSWDGRKWSVRGGREGLFIPVGLDFSELLSVTEGPTDTAALLDLGFQAIGRPSCTGGMRLIVELVRQNMLQSIVILADSDGPGQRGAESLARTLLLYCRSVRVVRPPDGIKDARAWKAAGATLADIQAAIEAAPVRSLKIERRSR